MPGKEIPRLDPSEHIPGIPSLPLSYAEAIPFLKALNGHGPKAEGFGHNWPGGRLDRHGVKYNIGPTPPDVVVNLYNDQEYTITPQWDVIGTIKGQIPDEVVIIGNHRDAWIAGGAGDPNSGSAALNEVVRAFGAATRLGWKPLRTLVFASWDGEEYGLVGSTEWVEEHLGWLEATAVAYLNVDVAAVGKSFKSAASPLLNDVLYYATETVPSPNQTVLGQTVRSLWNGRIATLGSGSDYTAFLDYAGIPSADMGFAPKSNDAIYQYHSNYDSFAWMDRFGDPGFKYHATLAKVISLAAAKLLETPVLAFNATDYAHSLSAYVAAAKRTAPLSSAPESNETVSAAVKHVDFSALDAAVDALQPAAAGFDARAAELAAAWAALSSTPWYHRWWKKPLLWRQIRHLNYAYGQIERRLLYSPGLDGRAWYKHVVYAPGRWTGYAGATLPGVVEALEDGDEERAQVSVSFFFWSFQGSKRGRKEEKTRLALTRFFL